MLSGARIASLVTFIAIAAIAAFATVDRVRAGVPNVALAPDGPTSNWRFVVTRAPAGSPLDRGDRVEVDDPRTLAVLTYHAFAVGSDLRVRRTSPPAQTWLAIPIVASSDQKFRVVVLPVAAMFLGIAVLIAMRGRTSGSLQLAWLFAIIVMLFNPTTPAWPTWLVLLYALVGGTLAVVAFACASDFALRFTEDPNAAWSRRFRGLSLMVAIVAGAANLLASAFSYFAPETPVVVQDAALGAFLAQALTFLVALTVAFAKASEAERQKVLWVVTSLGVGITGLVAAVVLSALGVKEPLRDVPLLLLIGMPLGCAYAILRYRLLDIGFVVNRATVFGITSLLVLAALALVDFGLQNLLGSWLVRSGLYVQLGLALAIGIATRPLHGRVDRFVDDLFFRQRHEAERALRQFVRDVPHINDAGVVLERASETVARAANLRCTILLANPDDDFTSAGMSEKAFGHTAIVNRNDSVVVRMLATREPVDLHGMQSAIAGDFAFPMFARDRLLGVLVCDGKADGVAAYAPDELDAIGAVAHATGVALDLLRIEALESELEALRSTYGITTSRLS